jgi:acylphosphatase
MTDLASVQVIVSGLVQGVYFRDFTSRQALKLGLSGYARNLPEGTVEVQAEGERKRLEKLIDCLRTGPPAARVSEVVINWSEYSGGYSSFRIKF